MKMRYVIRRAGRGLLHAKTRTLLTSLAIGVGAFALTLTMAAGEGARRYAEKVIFSNINPQQMFITKDKGVIEAVTNGTDGSNAKLQEYDENASSAYGSSASYKMLTQDDLNKLKAREDLEAVTPYYDVTAKYAMFEGADKKYSVALLLYNSGTKSEAAAGNLPKLGDDLGDGDITIPEEYAQSLKVSPASLIGKKVTLTVENTVQKVDDKELQRVAVTEGLAGVERLTASRTENHTYTIRAVTKKSATALSASPTLALSSSQMGKLYDFTMQGRPNYQKYFSVQARAADNASPQEVQASLQKSGYYSQTAKELQEVIFQVVNLLQSIVIAFSVITVIASIFGIINTQYISVLERTQQIGLMKALGMRRRDVARLFRYEAAWIGFLGGIIGAGTAFALGTALNPWITKQMSLGQGNDILVFQWMPIVSLIVGLVMVAIIAGYLPARKAAKLDPIEALRTE